MDQQEIRVYNMACAHNTITGILMRCGPVQFGTCPHITGPVQSGPHILLRSFGWWLKYKMYLSSLTFSLWLKLIPF
jgi:hypothetical protein